MHPMEKRFIYSYAAKYRFDNHTLLFGWMPFAKNDMLSIGFVTKFRRCMLQTEYHAGTTNSETTAGIVVGLKHGCSYKASINTDYRGSISFSFPFETLAVATLNVVNDFKRDDKPVQFGLAFQIGGLG